MRKLVVLLCAMSITIMIGVLGEPHVSATKIFSEAFIARYGPSLSALFGCNVCHSTESVKELNPYGRDLGNAFIPSGACLEFFPPNTHDVPKGFCGYRHTEGLNTPYTSGCGRCHGTDLQGLIAPSCFACHPRRWGEDPPAGTGSAGGGSILSIDGAFAMIEGFDSDGDGFSNTAEIRALTNPGDPRSFPDAMVRVRVKMNSLWDRGWVNSPDDLIVTLTPRGAREIDTRMYVSLRTTAGELVTTSLLRPDEEGRDVEAIFPQALLHVLFEDLAVRRATVVVSGVAEFGARFSTRVKVQLRGNAPRLLDRLTLKVTPHVWGDQGKVAFTIRGRDVKRIDIGKPITAVGTNGRLRLADVRRSRAKGVVTAVLDAAEARKLIGVPVLDGIVHTVALSGFSDDSQVTFNVAANVTTPPSDCYQFNPPRSHSVAKVVGECAYRHAPGFETPFAGKCNICHGPNLRGTSVTPSCFLCHPRLWSGVAPGPQQGLR